MKYIIIHIVRRQLHLSKNIRIRATDHHTVIPMAARLFVGVPTGKRTDKEVSTFHEQARGKLLTYIISSERYTEM